jgi:hypothetical protein
MEKGLCSNLNVTTILFSDEMHLLMAASLFLKDPHEVMYSSLNDAVDIRK